MGQTFSKQVFDGKKGYAEQQGRRVDLNAEQIAEAKTNTLFKDEANQNGKLDRISNLDGVNVFLIISCKTEVFYDVETGLKIKEVVTNEVNGKETKTATLLSDYKEVNGIKFPHKTSMSMGPIKLEFVVA